MILSVLTAFSTVALVGCADEAENNEKEQFSDERLVSLLKANADIAPKEIVEITFAEVERHADGANQSDDITVMCIKIS